MRSRGIAFFGVLGVGFCRMRVMVVLGCCLLMIRLVRWGVSF